MRFNVIIGNPPYQINNGGGKGASADPVYQKFIEKSIELKPLYISMITPSRWFSGSKPALKKFRKKIKDKNVYFEKIYDFENSKECFSNVVIDGGVSYFLINSLKTEEKQTYFHKISNGISIEKSKRQLFEKKLSYILRDNKSVSIINKIQQKEENNDNFSVMISSQDPFGFDKRIKGTMKRKKVEQFKKQTTDTIRYLDKRDKFTYIKKDTVSKNKDKISSFKLVIEKAIKRKVEPIFLKEDEVCSETFLAVFSPNKGEIINLKKYMETNLFNFLFYSKKISHNSSKVDFELIPFLDMSREWTDEELYERYDLTQKEISYIENCIKEMK